MYERADDDDEDIFRNSNVLIIYCLLFSLAFDFDRNKTNAKWTVSNELCVRKLPDFQRARLKFSKNLKAKAIAMLDRVFRRRCSDESSDDDDDRYYWTTTLREEGGV